MATKITAQMVKDLREMTGAGPLDAKKALEANEGELQKAVDWLREKGIAKANKKINNTERVMNEGLIGAYLSDDKKLGVLVEVNCETDFVARNDIFQGFLVKLANHIAQRKPSVIRPEDGENALLTQPYLYDESKTVEQALKDTVVSIGERLQISNMAVIEINEGIIGLYQHFTKTIGAMVAINTVNPELAYDLAMHVSNLKPKYLTREEVPAAEVEHEREVQRRRVIEEGQPEERADQIVQGRMTKQFFQEIILPEQVFLKDDKKTIAQLLKEKGNAQVLKMARFAIGETEAEASTE